MIINVRIRFLYNDFFSFFFSSCLPVDSFYFSNDSFITTRGTDVYAAIVLFASLSIDNISLKKIWLNRSSNNLMLSTVLTKIFLSIKQINEHKFILKNALLQANTHHAFTDILKINQGVFFFLQKAQSTKTKIFVL